LSQNKKAKLEEGKTEREEDEVTARAEIIGERRNFL